MNATIIVISRVHGTFSVQVPARFIEQISERKWYIGRYKSRAEGRQFWVGSYASGNRTLTLHRFIFSLVNHGDNRAVDHVDGDPLNNAEENLRPAVGGGNQQNRTVQRNNSSGFKGVHFCSKSGKFVARIRNNYDRIVTGRFNTAAEAGEAYAVVARELHGKFART